MKYILFNLFGIVIHWKSIPAFVKACFMPGLNCFFEDNKKGTKQLVFYNGEKFMGHKCLSYLFVLFNRDMIKKMNRIGYLKPLFK